ncbi:hypothetical protein THASP1DRAFT_25594 [Thamnocephalis sphaerospora]|uniref:Uncharacterized protein n=1 Tax=Thamnocephalis sphaerospora TaxID=78915 RepID=A0A4P9XJQ1_9FUNG|nr:hypothetical protein THASP1DRAFT_25594 [Thamnocephalis sphaerospora]|eukprot:RKP06007.1 hypothetical protein THASP1DRAFT_25594 [Thamnocephalis sphaerospora]
MDGALYSPSGNPSLEQSEGLHTELTAYLADSALTRRHSHLKQKLHALQSSTLQLRNSVEKQHNAIFGERHTGSTRRRKRSLDLTINLALQKKRDEEQGNQDRQGQSPDSKSYCVRRSPRQCSPCGMLQLQRQLKQLKGVEQIRFDRVETRLAQAKSDLHTHIHRVTGVVLDGDLPFRIRFRVDESTRTVRELRVWTLTKMRHELGGPLARAERDSNLFGVIRMLIDYARLDQQRRALFAYMTEHYGHYLAPHQPGQSINEDGHLWFIGHHHDDPELVFAWEMQVDAFGYVTPHVRLSVQLSPSWTAHDRQRVQDTAPQHFSYLIRQSGLQTAMEVMLQTFYMPLEHLGRAPGALGSDEHDILDDFTIL